MNPNDVMQDVIQAHSILISCSLVASALGGWVVYMFYARLRDIADELRKLRITYQFANEREAQRRGDGPADPTTPSSHPLTPTTDSEK
jgi:hypothetical protein